jgi:hypothetical protein
MHVIKIQTCAAFLLRSYIFIAREPLVGQDLLIFEASRSHTVILVHAILHKKKSSERLISTSQSSLPDKIKHLQETDIQAAGEIRTHNPSKRAAADPHLRPSDDWNRTKLMHETSFYKFIQNLTYISQVSHACDCNSEICIIHTMLI